MPELKSFSTCSVQVQLIPAMKDNSLIYTQKIPAGIDEVWDFFSDPHNLVKITPKEMFMRITNSDDVGSLYEGMTISYRLYPFFDFPVRWTTEIIRVERPCVFEDEQKSGPYDVWRHKHLFREIPGGVEMTDSILYRLPFGALGEFFNDVLIRRRLEYIFDYRRKKIEEIFGIVRAVAS